MDHATACFDRLRPWLQGFAQRALARAGDIPVAFLALLELREVFDVDDAEVAKALGKALGNALGKALASAARVAPRDVAVWLRGERERLACQRLALAQRTTG